MYLCIYVDMWVLSPEYVNANIAVNICCNQVYVYMCLRFPLAHKLPRLFFPLLFTSFFSNLPSVHYNLTNSRSFRFLLLILFHYFCGLLWRYQLLLPKVPQKNITQIFYLHLLPHSPFLLFFFHPLASILSLTLPLTLAGGASVWDSFDMFREGSVYHYPKRL